MPLEFIDESGVFRRYRLELQTQKESEGDSCAGCVFDVKGNCLYPHGRVSVEEDCYVYLDMVWKEVGQQLNLLTSKE